MSRIHKDTGTRAWAIVAVASMMSLGFGAACAGEQVAEIGAQRDSV
jgi:hypothetical protein